MVMYWWHITLDVGQWKALRIDGEAGEATEDDEPWWNAQTRQSNHCTEEEECSRIAVVLWLVNVRKGISCSRVRTTVHWLSLYDKKWQQQLGSPWQFHFKTHPGQARLAKQASPLIHQLFPMSAFSVWRYCHRVPLTWKCTVEIALNFKALEGAKWPNGDSPNTQQFTVNGSARLWRCKLAPSINYHQMMAAFNFVLPPHTFLLNRLLLDTNETEDQSIDLNNWNDHFSWWLWWSFITLLGIRCQASNYRIMLMFILLGHWYIRARICSL